MKRFSIFALVLAAATISLAAELVLQVDVARKSSALSWSFTEYCDIDVNMVVVSGGSSYNVNGYDTSLVLGGTTSGCVIEGVKTGYNAIKFTVPAVSMPTNGKYTVQITAMKDRRSEEWARGTLRVNVNPGMNYMPTCWMGYQKVAKLAASMLTVELLTNEVVQAIASNVNPKITYHIEPWTNKCIRIGKSFVPGLGRNYDFYWDRNTALPHVYRSKLYPGFTFYEPDGHITNAYLQTYIGGKLAVYTNDTEGTFVPANTNAIKKFRANAYFGNDTQWAEAILD